MTADWLAEYYARNLARGAAQHRCAGAAAARYT